MMPTIVISCVTFLLIIISVLFFPHIKIRKIKLSSYWIIALIGSIILLIFGYAPIVKVGKELVSNDAINPLKILILFFSMTILSIILDELGLFRCIASIASKHTQGNQFVFFALLYFLISLFTIFTSNDIVILTFTPFICFFAKRSKINPVPYLVMEFAAANTWSLMFVIGNPTNVYLATSNGISFVDYLKVMAVPTLVAGILEFMLLILIFKKQLRQPIEPNDVIYHLKDKVATIIGVSILGICLVFLVASSYINIEMWLISLICAVTLLLFIAIYFYFKNKDFELIIAIFKRPPYQLIPFFLSMFVIVIALKEQDIADRFANLLGNNNTIWVYGYSSFFVSNLINNIPMSILYTNVMNMDLLKGNHLEAIYGSIIGSNIGAFLTPIGALAGIMFTSLVNENHVRFSFIDFIKYGAIISLPVITIALFFCKLFV